MNKKDELKQKFSLFKWFDQTVANSLPYQILILFVMLCMIIIIGIIITYPFRSTIQLEAFPESYPVILKPVLWSLLHSTDPGYLGYDIHSIILVIIGILITLLGWMVMGGFLITALTNAFQRRVDKGANGLIRYNFNGNHGVILGWNHMGPSIVKQLFSDGCTEVVVLCLFSAGSVKSQTRAAFGKKEATIKDFFVLNGSFVSEEELKTLFLPQAREIVILGDPAMRGSDSRSIQAVMKISQMLRENDAVAKREDSGLEKKLPCYLHLANLRSYDLLQEVDLHKEDLRVISLRLFNFYENWARRLWCRISDQTDGREYPPLAYYPVSRFDRHYVHLFVIGFGQMGQALAILAARIAHYANSARQKTRITVIDSNMKSKKDEFTSHYSLESIPFVDFEFCSKSAEDEDIRKKMIESALDEKQMPTVAICISDPDEAMATALSLPQEVLCSKTPILVRQEISSGLSALAERIQNQKKWEDVHFFGMLEDYCGMETTQEKFAQMVHDNYLKDSRANGSFDETNPAFYPWDELSKRYKWSNRYQCDSFLERISSLGFKIQKESGKNQEVVSKIPEDLLFKFPKQLEKEEKMKYLWQIYSAGFTPSVFIMLPTIAAIGLHIIDNTIDPLARAEHNRWWIERALMGWRYADIKEKDEELLLHPYLIPYEQLTESIKEYDRSAIRKMPDLIEKNLSLKVVKPIPSGWRRS